MRQISPGKAKILDYGNLSGTERKRCDRDCLAGSDYERSQISRKRNDRNGFVAKSQAQPLEFVGGFAYWIGKSGEDAADLIRALDWFDTQIISEDCI